MTWRVRYISLVAAVLAACAVSFRAGARAQQQSLEGAFFQNGPGGTTLEVLFDGPSQGVEVDVGVITFQPGSNSGDHQHDQTEIFYVLEGALEHVVNGVTTTLDPGMLGHVKPPDFVNHVTGSDGGPTRAIVVWAPSGGVARIASRWDRIR